jgi:26S proteasome regulatory subunit N11
MMFGPRIPVQRHSDTAERILVSGMALLKMLSHARSGIPLEVIGIMLGRRLDEYTIEVADVFSTPQIATGSFVETQDEGFQVEMKGLLDAAGYADLLQIGWYHSHPGFDVWLSGTDTDNQKQMEAMDPRTVAIVVDPVRSVRGKVVIAAFRNIYTYFQPGVQIPSIGYIDPREKTSWIGEAASSNSRALAKGLNREFYEMPIVFSMSEHEETMLKSLHRPPWSNGFRVPSLVKEEVKASEDLKAMRATAQNYKKSILEEAELTKADLDIRHVGKVDPKHFIRQTANELSARNGALLARLHVTDGAFAPTS